MVQQGIRGIADRAIVCKRVDALGTCDPAP
jgi:hypothetical protein